jgi:dTMP kinase
MIVSPDHLQIRKPRGFLVLEGVNGAGKSTALKRVAQQLSEKGLPVVCTREPGATEVGAVLRPLLLESKPGAVSPLSELLLFGADRANHVKMVIEPALAKRHFVLCDRYYYSTAAFQCFGRGLSPQTTNEINRIAVDGVYPDLVLLFDLPPEEGLARNKARDACSISRRADKLEKEDLDFHHRVRNGFLELARTCPEPFVVIDTSIQADAVWQKLERIVDGWLRLCEDAGDKA